MKTVLTVLLIGILTAATAPQADAFQQRGGNKQKERGQNFAGQPGQRRGNGNAQRPGGPGQRGQADQPGAQDIEAMFERFDRNDDGRLTQNEVPRERRQQLASMDTNGDGACDLAEFTAAAERQMNQFRNQRGQQSRSAQLFAQFDSNADGLISPDEIPPNVAGQFAGIDTNGDGACDRSEMDAAMPEQRGSGARGQGQRGQGQFNGQGRRGGNGQAQRSSAQFGNSAQSRTGNRAQGGGRGSRGGGGRRNR